MMKSISPRKIRNQEMRQRILSAALELIVENGANKLSLREIARRIGHSPAGLYQYYNGKAEIIQAVRLGALTRFHDSMRVVPPTLPFTEFIVRLGRAYIRFARAYTQEFLLLFTHLRGEIEETPAEREVSRQSYRLLLDPVQQALEDGLIYSGEGYQAGEAAFSFWSLVHGLAMLRVSYPRSLHVDFTQAEEVAIRALAEGLKPA